MESPAKIPDFRGVKIVEIKGTLDPAKLRRLRSSALEKVREEREEEAHREALTSEEERRKARAAKLEEARKKRVANCISRIPIALECATREGYSHAYVFSSPRNDEDVAPEILEYCRALKGFVVKYEPEGVAPLMSADEFTSNDTIYHVVMIW